MNLDKLLAKSWIPDFLLRFGVRRRVKSLLKKQRIPAIAKRQQYKSDFVEDLKQQPIAVKTSEANEQHYELPPAFFEKILGERLKYSCGYWQKTLSAAEAAENLEQSEVEMLKLTCNRAKIMNGQQILDLGCGWGSLSIFMAENYPQSQITAVSNSSAQINYINSIAESRGLDNLTAATADINDYRARLKFDRIVSIEMFEHMRNYQALMLKLRNFLQSEGKLFVHIFTHHTYPFLYIDSSSSDWMTRYFFAGGTMPSQDLLHYFTDGFSLEKQWALSGRHYSQTLEAWLHIMDNKQEEIWPIFQEVYGAGEAERWWNYWRVFFLASSEFFGFNKGNEWFISHYLFEKS